MKIAFYTGRSRLFETTLIGHLYELSKKHKVVLLSEKLPENIRTALKSSNFTGIEEWIRVNQFSSDRGVFEENRRLSNIAKEAIHRFDLDVVVSPSDNDSTFELYLMRYAKREGVLRIAVQATVTDIMWRTGRWMRMLKAHEKTPDWLPMALRKSMVCIRDYISHFMYYWALPLSIGEPPFTGKSSRKLYGGQSGLRESSVQVVFSESDKRIYAQSGVPGEKIEVIDHPAKRNPGLFESLVQEHNKVGEKGVLILIPRDRVGFRRKSLEIISAKERYTTYKNVLETISKNNDGYKIIIKPHPETKDIKEIKELADDVFDDYSFIPKSNEALRYVRESSVVIGLPRGVTSVLMRAAVQYPNKQIISLDIDTEYTGDFYRNYRQNELNIEYIRNLSTLDERLTTHRNYDNNYEDMGSTMKTDNSKSISEVIIKNIHNQKKL